MTASWGLRKRNLFQVRARRIDLFGGALQSGFRAQYHRMSDEKFYGIGPASKEEDETNFAHKQAVGEIAIGRNIDNKFMTGVIAGIEHNMTRDGEDDATPSTKELFTDATLPGIQKEITMGRLQTGFYLDRRNRWFRPSSGFDGELRGGLFTELGDDEYGYTSVIVDINQYIHLFRNRILVLRVAGQFVDPLSDRAVPFYSLAELGSEETIRGFQRGRFRDRDVILGSLEYRYPIWRAIDALFFFDTGQVATSIFDDFKKDNLEYTYGGGFHLWGREGTLVRLEVGKSTDGFRFHFILNPSSQSRRSYVYF